MRPLLLSVVAFVAVACAPSEPVDIGASCSVASVTQACAKGNKLATCNGGKWQESMSCPGTKGCYLHAAGHGSKTPLCDESLAREGNACSDARDVVCSEDRRSRLGCKGGRWSIQASCPKGCVHVPTGIACD